MIKEAMEKVLELQQQPTFQDCQDRERSTSSLRLITEPESPTLDLHTLTGLVHYAEAELKKQRFFAHVVSPTKVNLITPIWGDCKQRTTLVCSSIDGSRFSFGQWKALEPFIIGLRSQFADTPDRNTVIEFTSGVTKSQVMTAEDDGISQSVTRKSSLSRMETAKTNPIVSLAPYRTFREVDQPESEFLFRFNGGGPEELPSAALFEADGGAWENEAMKRVAEYLTGSFSGDMDVKVIW